MKTLSIIAALLLGVGYVNAQEKKEKGIVVPEATKAALLKQFPNAKDLEWGKKGDAFEVEFELNKEEAQALIDASGKIIEVELEIDVAQLPKAIADYVAKNLEAKKIKEADKITDANGTVTYEVEVGSKEYIFDAAGTFVKIEDERDDD